jgi:hypothetical protein
MASRRRAVIAFAVVAILGLAALALGAIDTKSSTLQTLGVGAAFPVAPLHPHGGVVCEDPIALAEPITHVRFTMGTHGLPGTALDITVSRSQPGGRTGGPMLARGHLNGGWVERGLPQTVPVSPRVAPGQYVRVCIQNTDVRWAYAWGDLGVPQAHEVFPSGPRPTITPTNMTVDGIGIRGDISMAFVGNHRRSLLTRLPKVFERATAFRPGFVGAWTYWLLLALVLVAAPVLLGRALIASLREPREQPAAAPESNGHGSARAATVEPLRHPEDAAASSRGSRD